EITSIRTAGFSSTSREIHSIPSICGIVRSIVTTSGSAFLKSSSASTPLPAVPISSSSSNCCERSMRLRMIFESSTIISLNDRFRAPFAPLMLLLSMGCAHLLCRIRRKRTGDIWPARSAPCKSALHHTFLDTHDLSTLRSDCNCCAGRFRRRQHDLETCELAGVCADANLAPQRVNAASHHVHAHAASGIHRDFLLGREPGAENQGHGGPGIHARGLFLGQNLFTHRSSLELIG